MPAANMFSNATAAEVRAQRDRMLASKAFSLSKRQSAFLDYVVNAALEDRTDKLKEFNLGMDVFDKDESFDPSIDSIVRVEASRLRGKLRDYYDDEGRGDTIRIEIPKGHYVPVFRPAEEPKVEARHSFSNYIGTVLAIAALLISTVYFANRITSPDSTVTTEVVQLPPPSSLAVLPLRDWSSLPEEYFSEAMTDALISSLAELPELRVISLTSIMNYQDTAVSIPEIGRALGVAYIVEGSISRDEENVRVTAQLVVADTDERVWSNTFDRPVQELLSVQSEVANAIAAQISYELSPAQQLPERNLNPAAYEAYMKGRYFYNQFTAEGYRRGMQYFQEAIDIDPKYAEAYAGLASCHCLLAGHGLELIAPTVSIPESYSLAMKALSINDELAEPYAFLGIINFKFGWDVEKAETMLNRAIELNPSLYQAYVWHSQLMEAMGRHDDAISRARYAKQLNPLSLAAGLNLGWQLYQADKYIEAGAEIDKLIEFNPNFWGGHWARGHIYNQHEMHGKAIAAFQRAVELEGGHSLPVSALGYTYAIAGRPDDARQILSDLEILSRDIYVSPYHIATVYAGLNEPDLMFYWLERAYEVRARSLAWLHVSKEMQAFHEDARFQDILKRIGIYETSQIELMARQNYQ